MVKAAKFIVEASGIENVVCSLYESKSTKDILVNIRSATSPEDEGAFIARRFSIHRSQASESGNLITQNIVLRNGGTHRNYLFTSCVKHDSKRVCPIFVRTCANFEKFPLVGSERRPADPIRLCKLDPAKESLTLMVSVGSKDLDFEARETAFIHNRKLLFSHFTIVVTWKKLWRPSTDYGALTPLATINNPDLQDSRHIHRGASPLQLRRYSKDTIKKHCLELAPPKPGLSLPSLYRLRDE